jgi:glutamate 5-kinase
VTLVVKLGTSLVAGPDGAPRNDLLHARAREIDAIYAAGEPVCVVSSGAIALGLPRLGLPRRPRALPRLQAASALGQARLQSAWDGALAPRSSAQVLLSAADLSRRDSYLNARNALLALLRARVVPVVNENDATATDEITFGDNDALAAQIAIMLRARLLVLLTEVEGVYSREPGHPAAEILAEGSSAVHADLAGASGPGRGGMRSKVAAAEMAAAAGITTVIASGNGDAVLGPIVAGERRGTRFSPSDDVTTAFKLWLRFAKPVTGTLVVDDGARRAIVGRGASLLTVGIVSSDGAFEAGDAVDLAGLDGVPFARGIAELPAGRLAEGRRGVTAVHRDRLVLLGSTL